jgi:hypothetical protein
VDVPLSARIHLQIALTRRVLAQCMDRLLIASEFVRE